MFGLFVLVLALATRGDARGITRETVLATFNAALTGLSSDIEARADLLVEQVSAHRQHDWFLHCIVVQALAAPRT